MPTTPLVACNEIDAIIADREMAMSERRREAQLRCSETSIERQAFRGCKCGNATTDEEPHKCFVVPVRERRTNRRVDECLRFKYPTLDRPRLSDDIQTTRPDWRSTLRETIKQWPTT